MGLRRGKGGVPLKGGKRGRVEGRGASYDCGSIRCNCRYGIGSEETRACAGNPRGGIGRDESRETEFFEGTSIWVDGADYGGC